MDYETYYMLFSVMREEKEKWVGDYHLRYVENYSLPKIVVSKSINGNLLKGLDTLFLEQLCYDLKQLEKYSTITEYLTHVENELSKTKEEENRIKSKVDSFLQ